MHAQYLTSCGLHFLRDFLRKPPKEEATLCERRESLSYYIIVCVCVFTQVCMHSLFVQSMCLAGTQLDWVSSAATGPQKEGGPGAIPPSHLLLSACLPRLCAPPWGFIRPSLPPPPLFFFPSVLTFSISPPTLSLPLYLVLFCSRYQCSKVDPQVSCWFQRLAGGFLWKLFNTDEWFAVPQSISLPLQSCPSVGRTVISLPLFQSHRGPWHKVRSAEKICKYKALCHILLNKWMPFINKTKTFWKPFWSPVTSPQSSWTKQHFWH